MLIFEEGEKPENPPEKNPRSNGENQQQTQPTHDDGYGNRTWDTLEGGERSHHCATPAPPQRIFFPFRIQNDKTRCRTLIHALTIVVIFGRTHLS